MPIEGADAEDAAYLSAADALKLVLDDAVNTFAPASVAKTVWRRIATYAGPTLQ